MSEPSLTGQGRPSRGSMTVRAFALLTVLVVLVLTLAVPIRSWLAQRAQLESLSAEVAKGQQQVADLEALRARWDDPAFVAAQARERLHFVLPGEVGYTVIGADSTRAADEAQSGSTAEGPWFEVLWKATVQADSGSAAPK